MPPTPEEIGGALDPARFAELAYDLGPDGAHELVREFLHLTPASVAELPDAAEGGDAEARARAPHRPRPGGAPARVRRFLPRAPASVAELGDAAEPGDAEALARAAHRLGGGCLSIG